MQAEVGKYPKNQNGVMGQGNNSTNRELVLEAECDVEHNERHSDHHPQTALITQLLTNLWANKLDPLDDDITFVQFIQLSGDLTTQSDIRLRTGNTNQHIIGRAKFLHESIRMTELFHLATNGRNISLSFITQLHQRTAGKVQAKVDTFSCQTGDRSNHQDCREHSRQGAELHKIKNTNT